MNKAISRLEKNAENMAGIYADVTGEDVDVIRADMKAETWFSADEAVARGFATTSNDNKAVSASAYDYSLYAHAPQRLAALATTKNWSHAGLQRAGATTSQSSSAQKDTTMKVLTDAEKHSAEVDKAKADGRTEGATATKERIRSIMTSEEAKGRETLAEHLAYSTDMPADEAIATLKVAPQAAAGADNSQAETYEQARLAAAGLTAPGGGKETKKSSLSAAVDRQIETMKR